MYLFGMTSRFGDDQDRTLARMPSIGGSSTHLHPTVQELTPFLVVLFPLDQHKSIPIPADSPLTIGRSLEATLQIPDEMISRIHCEIRRLGPKILLRDMGSTNGTFLDGVAVQQVELKPGNRLQVGSAVLKVDLKDPSEVEREKALFEAATTDALTRLPNRRFFLERAQSECSLARREKRLCHALLIDVDKFKSVNDTYGHAAGDFVLKEVARTLAKVRREEDLVARFGGEEFIFFTTGIDSTQAQVFAERVRTAIESHKIVWDDKHIPVTISIGLKSLQMKDSDTLDSIIASADAFLYQAKNAGRNRVIAG